MLALGPTGPLNWYRAIGGATRPQATPIEVPTLYIWGDRDVAFGREAAEATEEYITGPYHFVELTGASHWIPDEHWDDVQDLVLEHLREHPVGKTRALT
jgi:pimeloyl-ACP methyl ester carboxylesterase